MTVDDLISRGYFPKELPPPFHTKSYAAQLASILSQWQAVFQANAVIGSSTFSLPKLEGETNTEHKARKKRHADAYIAKYGSSKSCIFSISKGKYARRLLAMPNPKHFALLCKEVSAYWTEIDAVYDQSKYSWSRPIPQVDFRKRAVITRSKGVTEFRRQLLSASMGKMVQLKVDISKFYPTIYTHSITWALLGKNEAKKYFKVRGQLDSLVDAGDLGAALYKAAERIDDAQRACQERQSIGIPIGPDTSHIIAEAIACRIDGILQEKFTGKGLNACRYYDDYFIYVSNRELADQVLKQLQLVLSDFQLEINEAKVSIREFPFGFEDDFASALYLFDFNRKGSFNHVIQHYFSLLWGFGEKHRKDTDTIFKYGLRTFEFRTVTIPKASWRLFEALLIKTALMEPSVLDVVTRILLSYESNLDETSKVGLSNLIQSVIEDHCQVRHNFEIAWALWIAKTFGIKIPLNTAQKVVETWDNVSILILLDLANTTDLVQGLDLGSIEQELKDDILFSENWLLAYEGVRKGWLNAANPNIIEDNKFFNLLKLQGVEFYDGNRQLEIYAMKNGEQLVGESPSYTNIGLVTDSNVEVENVSSADVTVVTEKNVPFVISGMSI